MKQRLDFIDICKAFAILLMIILHTTYTYRGMTEYVASFHMAIFFFAAGMFAKDKNTSIRVTITKSFNQLIIPYFVFSILGLFYGWVYPHLHPELYQMENGSFSEILKKAIWGIVLMRDRVTSTAFHPSAALWFLISLFWCRILFCLWIHSSKRDFYLLRITIVAFLVICHYFDISLFSLTCTSVSFLYYFSGYYLNRFVIKIYKSIRVEYLVFIALLALGLIFFLKGYSVKPDDAKINGNFFLAYLRGFLGILAVIAIAIVLDKSSFKAMKKLFIYLGTATLTILGLHLAGIILFKTIFVTLGGQKEFIPIYLVIPVTLIIAVVCAIIHHSILERKAPWIVGKSNFIK